MLHGHEDDLDAHVTSLLALREPSYEQTAHSIVWTDQDSDVDALALKIKQITR
jgi:hypothetical protein